MTMTKRTLIVPALSLALMVLLLDPAVAATDPFSEAVTWFTGGPARGVAMLAVAAIAVLAWFMTASLRFVGMVLGGGLLLANVDTIVGWMGF